MTRTFELSADGRRLYETLHIDHGKKSAIVIRYVYDAATADVQSGIQEADPDRPVLKRHSANSNPDGQGSDDTSSDRPAVNQDSDDRGSPVTQGGDDSDPNRPVLKRHSDDSSSSPR